METIALVFGGDSLESEISILTCLKVIKEFQKQNWKFVPVYLDHLGQFYTGAKLFNKDNYQNKKGFIKGRFVKNKERYYFKTRLKKYYFDYVLPIVHGKGTEDGTLGAFFDLLQIPCIYGGIINASILQDKAFFKRFLKVLKIKQPKYKTMKYYQYINANLNVDALIKGLTFPLIVKPSHLGSSIGVKKVFDKEQLIEAINEAFYYDDEVIIEECIKSLKEVNIAVVGYQDDLTLSAFETVNQSDQVFSFYQKYESEVPFVPFQKKKDNLDEELKDKIVKITTQVYEELSCFGVVRFDFLIDQEANEVYLNEINTIPGSLAFYLFEDIGIDFKTLLERLIAFGKKKIEFQSHLYSSFDQSFLSKIHLKNK